MAIRPTLIDTGPLVAYLDRSDAEHELVADFLDDFSGALCSTSAVVTEAMHLLMDAAGPRRLAEFISAARVHVFECTRPEQLLAAAGLMEKYADAPMDFADATLVLLADRMAVSRIVTLDRRGFRIFRTPKGKAFEVLPH